MNLKSSKIDFKKKKQESRCLFIVASLAVMVIHCCIWFEKKSQL